LSRKVSREAAIQALIGNPNVKEAAQTCGVSERTMHRWLKEPGFSRQLEEAQRGVTNSLMRSVISRAERAAETLDSIMANSKASAHARVAAARTLLEFSFKAVELGDIMKRLEALELSSNR